MRLELKHHGPVSLSAACPWNLSWPNAIWATFFGLSSNLSSHIAIVTAFNYVDSHPNIGAPQPLVGVSSTIATLYIASLFTNVSIFGIDRTARGSSFGQLVQCHLWATPHLTSPRR